MPMRFDLTAEEVAEIQRPVNGQGGFQTVMRGLQASLQGQHLELTDAEVGRILRYLTYRPGGFEGRLAEAFRRNIVNLLG
jgi:hypothetical protein